MLVIRGSGATLGTDALPHSGLTVILTLTPEGFLGLQTLTLDVRDVGVQRQPGDRVHEDALPHGGAPPRAPLEEHRRLHVDERQGDELGDATCPLLEVPKMKQVAGPVMQEPKT
jgi:hypothetical protein